MGSSSPVVDPSSGALLGVGGALLILLGIALVATEAILFGGLLLVASGSGIFSRATVVLRRRA